MLTNGDITIYHFNGSVFLRRYFKQANIFTQTAGDINKGLTVSKQTIVRIPSNEYIELAPGDRAVMGQCEADKPPKGNDTLIIKEVTDNRRGSPGMRHWKVVCE